jgi:hypothetical protein
VDSLKLGLKVSEDLHRVAHLLVDHKLVWHLERDEEAGGVSFSLQIWKPCQHPKQNMLQSLLVSMNHFSTEIRVEVSWVSKNFKETTDTLLSLVLSLFLHINRLVSFVQVRENFVN